MSPTVLATLTQTVTPTVTGSFTATATTVPSITATATPTSTIVDTVTPSPTIVPSFTPTDTPTTTSSSTATPTSAVTIATFTIGDLPTTITSTDGQTRIFFPVGSLTGQATDVVQVTIAPEPIGHVTVPGELLAFKLTTTVNGNPVTTFGVPVQVEITYNPVGLASMARLAPQGLSRYSSQFEERMHVVLVDDNGAITILPTTVDTVNHRASASIPKPTTISLVPPVSISYAPKVLNGQSSPTDAGW